MAIRRVELIVPAEDNMMLVIRLATMGVISRANLTLDKADDLKMAVEEAASCLIRFSKCDQIQLQYLLGDEKLRVLLSGDNCLHCWAEQKKDELYTIQYILESMVDQVQLSGTDEGLTSIELIKQFD
ncbi:hypothetical protein LJC33_03485 [Eubacteriales bacterium OttesenSCG-928-N13]|nr:hypothetical protein [Eubacteriales bacterium OttesenSCG-928-N13]